MSRWNINEMEYLEKNYPIQSMGELLEGLPNRSVQSILSRAKNRGYKKRKRSQGRLWSPDELEYLKNNYNNIPIKGIMESLPGRSYTAITTKGRDLGISKRRD